MLIYPWPDWMQSVVHKGGVNQPRCSTLSCSTLRSWGSVARASRNRWWRGCRSPCFLLPATEPAPQDRAAGFEDRAKPVWVSLPFVAVAVAAVLLFGHFVSYRKGRPLGRDGKDKNL